MKAFRQVVFWVHLAVGISAGLVVLIMSVTGVLLTYERQMIARAEMRGLEAGPPVAGAARLPTSVLVERAVEEAGATPTAVTWRSASDAPMTVAFGSEGNRFVNSYTGTVLGQGAPEVRAFFTSMRNWHRYLAREGDSRPMGRAITGASNLGFLFLVVSGFYLWWPRNWSPRALRNVIFFRRGISGKARDFNWHNVIGFWSAVPLFVVVLSGVVISYPWAGNLVYRVMGEDPPAPRAAGAGPNAGAPGGRGGNAPADERELGAVVSAALARVDALRAVAETYEPEWRTIALTLPTNADAPLVFTLDSGDGGQPQRRGTLTFDQETGTVSSWEPFSAGTAGRRLRSFLRFAHTGEYFGIPGQTLAGLVSAGAVVLVWTGFFLGGRRFKAWTARKGRPSGAIPESSSGSSKSDPVGHRRRERQLRGISSRRQGAA